MTFEDIKKKALWLALLMPGFVTVGTARLISSLPGAGEFELTFVFLLISYMSFAFILLPYSWLLKKLKKEIQIEKIIFQPLMSLAMLLTSALFGILLAIAYENDFPNKVAHSIVKLFGGDQYWLTESSNHSSMHSGFRLVGDSKALTNAGFDRRHRSMRSAKKMIRVIPKATAGLVYVGVPQIWDLRNGDRHIFLTPACIEGNSTRAPVLGSGVWIRLDTIHSVEILDVVSNGCVHIQQIPP